MIYFAREKVNSPKPMHNRLYTKDLHYLDIGSCGTEQADIFDFVLENGIDYVLVILLRSK